MKRRGLLFAVLAVAAVLGLGALAFAVRDRFEKVEVEEYVGYHGEAFVNPLLAAERLYDDLGVHARTLAGGLSRMPPNDYALLLVSPRRAIGERQMNALRDWVKHGGRLVVAIDEAPTLDPILAWLHVHAVGDREKEPGRETLEMATRTGKVLLDVPRAPRLVDELGKANFSVGSASGYFLLRFYEGAGRVLVLSDASFLTNRRIGQAGHARAAWSLVNAQEPPKGVWIVVREDIPTLFGLLARHAAAASASVLLFLAAWLWFAGARFGPVALDPSRDRRSLLEHIEAAGELLFRVGRGADLVQAVREALLRRVEVREPEIAKLPPDQMVQRLAGLTKTSPARVNAALNSASIGAGGPADLTTAVQTLETLRRSL
jgi:Domain of unknown function (DUF4350)